MDKTPRSDKSQVPNLTQGTVTIPVEKLIELLQRNQAINASKRSPLIRAKSDPVNGPHTSGTKRKSIPEVFIFPDVKENSPSNSDTPHISSNSVSIDGRKGSDQSDDNVPRSEYDGMPRRDEYIQKAEIMPLSLSYEDKQSSNHGVSEVYFKNVVNELVKTKKCLKDLQAQHKLMLQDKSENDLLKKELQQLRFTAQHLQREHRKMMDQNKKLKMKLSAYQPPGMNDSFELGIAGEMEFSEKEAQTEPELMGSFTCTGTMVRIWQQSMEDRRKENVELTRQYDELKNNVKILNSCLNEEKIKNRKKDKELQEKETERRTAFSQLSLRRQELDELKQEYAALKKTVNLWEDDPSHYNSQRYGSRSSGRQTTISSRSSRQSNSGDQILLNIPPKEMHPNYGRQGQNTAASGSVPSFQNYLSSIDDDEKAPSNLPLPFSGHSSRVDSEQSRCSSESNMPSIGQGTLETEPHQELPCPACLQTFQNDDSFLKHLAKCLPY